MNIYCEVTAESFLIHSLVNKHFFFFVCVSPIAKCLQHVLPLHSYLRSEKITCSWENTKSPSLPPARVWSYTAPESDKMSLPSYTTTLQREHSTATTVQISVRHIKNHMGNFNNQWEVTKISICISNSIIKDISWGVFSLLLLLLLLH